MHRRGYEGQFVDANKTPPSRYDTPTVAFAMGVFVSLNAALNVFASYMFNLDTYVHVRVRSHDWLGPRIPVGSAPRALLDDFQAPGLEALRDAHYTFCWSCLRLGESGRPLLSSVSYCRPRVCAQPSAQMVS